MKITFQRTKVEGGRVTVGDFPVVLLCILIIISETPIIARNVPNIVFYGIALLFLGTTYALYFSLSEGKKRILILLGLYLLLLLIYKILVISSADLAYYSTTVKFFFFMVAMLLLADYLTTKQKYFLLFVIIGTILAALLDNIRLYREYGSSVYVHLFQWMRFTTNSMNTTYVTSLLLLSGALFVVVLQTRRRWLRLLAFVFILFNIIFITSIAQRMIILMLGLLMFPLLALNNIESTRNRWRAFAFVTVLVGLCLIFFNSLVDLLDKLIGSPRMTLRFEQIKNFFSSSDVGDAGGSMAVRIRLYGTSIHTWFSSVTRFLFGAGDHRATNEIIGNHSDFIDECARYGLMGMMIWIPLTWEYLKQIVRSSQCKSEKSRRQLKVILCIYLLNGLVSSIYEATVGIQVFLLIPIVFSLIKPRETKPTIIEKNT